MNLITRKLMLFYWFFYDITNKESFEEIKNYYCPKIRKLCRSNIPIILLGNKTDKENERQMIILKLRRVLVVMKLMRVLKD